MKRFFLDAYQLVIVFVAIFCITVLVIISLSSICIWLRKIKNKKKIILRNSIQLKSLEQNQDQNVIDDMQESLILPTDKDRISLSSDENSHREIGQENDELSIILHDYGEEVQDIAPQNVNLPPQSSYTTLQAINQCLMTNNAQSICSDYEFPRKNLEFIGNLGMGEFGLVRHAFAQDIVPGESETQVAVKSIIGNIQYAKDALLYEMKVMLHIGKHQNIVNLLGIVTLNYSAGDFMIVTEYCSLGNVRDFLRKNKENFVNEINAETDLINSSLNFTTIFSQSEIILTTSHLLIWAFQVAKAMDFLASKKVIHGDLAARNILLCDAVFVKICDFGLSRIKQESNYYRKRDDSRFPVKWVAVETIHDNIFSTYSDIWSFGVVLWEFFSLGAEPYAEMKMQELCQKIVKGYRMPQPEFSTNFLYSEMLRCWHEEKKARPTFSELENIFGHSINASIRNYLDSSEKPREIVDRNIQSRGTDYISRC
ncbi:vascular endothelial growth factor receptor 2-like [Phlebotomus argentipes]|uniref:vascular endothelial growth factor receptor 2-like n=1 Tax=Phlebotomus argentipes TaxID=94469 RepID=UPI00289360ED|nr:vascular endothelial growth factor receptor 2-like [Phlebotomus argentipes]